MTSKDKGNIALGRCIQYFTSKGFTILLPLNDAQDYDIAIDDGKNINKIQVKYTTQRTDSGYFFCKLCTCGHKDSNGKSYEKPANFEVIDYFWITNVDDEDWLIPAEVLTGMKTVTLNKDRQDYKLN